MQMKALKDIVINYNPIEKMRQAFESLKNELPLMKRINSDDIRQMLSNSRMKNIQIIGSVFQMLFILNKLFSNFKIKSMSLALQAKIISYFSFIKENFFRN